MGGRMRLTILVVCLLLSGNAFGSDLYAPLPDKILQAKTIYIENKTGNAGAEDRVFQEMTKGKYFRVVSDKTKADLVFILTLQTHEALGSNNTSVTNRIGNTTITNGGGVYSYTTGSVTLTIADPQDDSVVWTNTKPLSKKGATHDLMDDLEKRLKNQKPQTK
jgi:hypothetical protein